MTRGKGRIFITGGGGYCGSVLVPQLLSRGYHVTVYDTFYFGSAFLPTDDANLNLVTGDIRDSKRLLEVIPGHDTFISLACISNDASFELDEALSTSINYDAFRPMVQAAKQSGISRFVYASSSSVYGVSEQPEVKEDHPLVPLTLYNKFKGLCEPILNEFASDDFTVVTFRPATVCGYAPRLRLDLSVNILTHHAITKNRITVFGGRQLRPNLYVGDYADVCELLLEAPHEKIQQEVFNVGFENMSILEIAHMVKKVVAEEYPNRAEIKIDVTSSNDNRSYHINSDKINRVLGFKPKKTVEDSIRTLCRAFRDGLIPDSEKSDIYYNIRTMKALGVR